MSTQTSLEHAIEVGQVDGHLYEQPLESLASTIEQRAMTLWPCLHVYTRVWQPFDECGCHTASCALIYRHKFARAPMQHATGLLVPKSYPKVAPYMPLGYEP